jgi:iron complex transport system substrate-binding protein
MVSKRQGIIVVIVAIVLVAAGLVALNGSGNKNANTIGTDYVIDALGHNVTTTTSPQRIVSTSPALTTLVYALGAQGRLVAVDSYSTYPSNVTERVENKTLAVIGGFYDPNPESIVNASGANSSSSLVLLDSSVKADVDIAAKLDLFGISYVFFYQSANTTEVYQNIVLGGTVLHESSNATKLVTSMQERMASIESSVGTPASKAKVVFMDYYGSNSGYPSNIVGNDSFINDIITVAGGVNAFGNETGYQDVSGEAVVAADPDYIIVSSSMNGQDSQAVYDQIMNDTVLSLTPAVLHQHVYIIHDQMEDCFLQNGIREVDGAQILAEILYPSEFNNVTVPHVLGDEYLNYLPSSWNTGSTAAHVVMETASG